MTTNPAYRLGRFLLLRPGRLNGLTRPYGTTVMGDDLEAQR